MSAKRNPDEAGLARALTADPTDADALASAERWIEAGRGRALLDALVHEQRGDDVDRKTVIERVMVVLEAMTVGAPHVAGALMVRLRATAGHRGLHDVHDAIGLYIEGCDDPRLPDFLDAIVADRTVAPSLARACERWARRLRARKAP